MSYGHGIIGVNMTTALNRILKVGLLTFLMTTVSTFVWGQDSEVDPTESANPAETETIPLVSPENDLGLFDPIEAPPTEPALESPEQDSQQTESATQQPSQPDPNVDKEDLKAKLDLDDDLIEEIRQDPFSYLGNIQYEDIYVVQKIYARKSGRYYVTAVGGGGNFFSQFHTSMANGFGAGMYFTDNWGWEVFHGLFTHTFVKQRHDLFLNQFELWSGRLQFRINYALSSAAIFSPFYGKVALFGSRVLHYDIYFLAGPAVTLYEEFTLGYGGVAGVGFRTFFNKWSSVGLEFRDYIYMEAVPPTLGAELGISGTEVTSRFFIFLNFTVFFPKFKFMEEV
jgi:outer membrane beta-barrel protein